MATLTGFKQMSESADQRQQTMTNGQQNPVFVFDEVAQADTTNDEEFVDAQSQPQVSNDAIKQQQQQQQRDKTNQVAKSMGKQNNDSNSVQQPSSTPPQRQQTNKPQPQQQQQQQQARDNGKQPLSATGTQLLQKGAVVNSNNGDQQRQSQNSLMPGGGGGDGDNLSMSMLAVDCAGTGKSPRTPRRSPLMALFRGKPRESTRRLYTDEDQFQIEWANLSLSVQKKWYQKLSLSSMLMSEGSKPESGSSSTKPALILQGVDGRVKSGEITAILGPSGAGKTSLLNVLFGKYRAAVKGAIKVTGAPSKKHLTVCTIPQSDYLIGYLTTEESLWFASRLKNTEDDFNHDRNIERVIELLGLQRCRDTRIHRLSGGQYKRVSIAQEMLSSPDILVLDEPTSGLDSLTCYRTVKVLRDLVEASKAHNLVNPMSIVLTIHQPHREVLDLFHSVYVLAVGGLTMYQGPPSEMEDFINKCSGTIMPATGYNPASYMIELASEEYGKQPIELLVAEQRRRFKASTAFQYNFGNETGGHGGASVEMLYSSNNSLNNGGNSASNKMADSTITLYPLNDKKKNKYVEIDLSSSSNAIGGGGANHYDKPSSSGGTGGGGGSSRDIDSRIMTPRSGKNSDGVFWRHVNLMSKRCFLSTTRDPLLCTIRIGAHIFIPLIVAIIYGPKMGIPNGCPFYKPEINLLEYASIGVAEIQEKHDDLRIQFQNVGLHFMVYYAFCLCMLAFTAISFPLIMHVLVKEIRNGWYSLSTFIYGKMLAELPMALILPPISVGIIYIMTGQPASYLHWRYLVQSLILILIIMIAEAKGLIFGAVCMNSMQTAVFAASVSTVPFILLCGFLIRIHEVPYILQGFARFSYFKHAVEALIITRYGFGMCPCDPALIPIGGTPRIVGIPAQVMSLTDYYIGAFVANPTNGTDEEDDTTVRPMDTNVLGNNRNIDRIVESITTLSPEILDSAGATSDTPTTTTTAATTTTTTTAEPTTIGNSDEASSSSGGASSPSSGGNEPGSDDSSSSRRRRRRHHQHSKRQVSTTATTVASVEEDKEPPTQGVFFDKLAALLTRANAFGYSIQTCDDVEPFTMKDMLLKDHMLAPVIGYLFLSIIVMKFFSYFIVDFCVKLKL